VFSNVTTRHIIFLWC
jgi:hypothetical protein